MALWLISLLTGLAFTGHSLPFYCSEPLQTSPSDELRCLYEDRRGMMWIGTTSGLKSYDGYSLLSAPADTAGILPSKTILSITEDPGDNLWLGTRGGLARLDRRRGTYRSWGPPDCPRESIYTLFTASDGTVWIGTDSGLSRYNVLEDSFTTYDASNAWVVTPDGERRRPESYSVKSIVETPDGDLFIGTWSSGLLRFDPSAAAFFSYPAFNDAGSAFSLLLDSRDRLWIGTWGQGLYLMEHPLENSAEIRCLEKPGGTPRNFTRIVEDSCGGVVWAGDIDGICLFDFDHPDTGFRTCRDTGGQQPRPLRYCSDIISDQWGNVWLGMLYDGVFHVRTRPSPFRSTQLGTPDSDHPRSSVSTIYTDDGQQLWLGLLPYGLALHDTRSGQTRYNRDIPGFAGIREEVFRATVSAIIRRPDGAYWIGTKGDGILVAAPGRKATLLTAGQTGYLAEDYITALFCDENGYTWVGTRAGLALVAPDGGGRPLSIRVDGRDLSRCDVNHIARDRRGSYWISTESMGILRIDGRSEDPSNLQFFQYNAEKDNFIQDEATACFEDRSGTLWAISNGGGLSRLNRLTNRFEQAGETYRIGVDRILAIDEDAFGDLWLTTDNALIRLRPAPRTGEPPVRWYTREDGLGDILFFPNATFRFGEQLFFGSRNGFFTYGGPAEETPEKPLRLAITGLSVDGVPYASLPSGMQAAMSAQTPMFTRRLIIPASVREFSLDFSLLSHLWESRNYYAFLLDGYDRDWHYLTRGHSATFQNLPPGTYQFRLRAAAKDGHWQEMGYALPIQILPHWYETWWAKFLSVLLFAAGVFLLIRRYTLHLRNRQYRQMNQLLTNLSHELLTPLAVISGSVEEMQREHPGGNADYTAIHHNVSRISRTLRQILEVRKSEAGKLRLLVSEGDLAAFVKQECQNIRPMADHQGIHLEERLERQPLRAWFDADKMDKILYNLISNAIKYNRENGYVEVGLREDAGRAVLSVRDSGIGISADKRKHLYKRFVDGDYRKMRVSGTGLGLSLTRELVRLHHGDIRCESEEGVGTTFTVSFPILRKAYAEAEIDTSSPQDLPDTGRTLLPPLSSDSAGPEYAMLIVEDNDELLELMARSLSRRFRVFKAHNGVQALSLIHREELDIVVSDVMMPQMDGLELTRRIKESEDYAQLPVVLLTARTEEEDRLSGFQTGADDYLTKPFKMRELGIRVDNIIRNRERIRRIFCRQTELPAGTQHCSSPEDRFLERAVRCVLNHLEDGAYDRESFARDMYMSSSSLYNKLRASTGQNISGFVNSIRLKEACRIAREQKGISIAELSERVGYNSPRYFAMCFKKEFGKAPKEFLDREGGVNGTDAPAAPAPGTGTESLPY